MMSTMLMKSTVRWGAAAPARTVALAAASLIAVISLVCASPVNAQSSGAANAQSSGSANAQSSGAANGAANAQSGAAANNARAEPLLTKPLAGIEGKEALVLTLDLPPGADSPPHRHNANTFVYVLEGSVVMQVAGQPAVTLTKGQTFYESPSDVHTVSRNPSRTDSARILVFMVKDQGAPATVPAK
jgi:quercetin dioxygenase-like cupin family protein